ncbi:MAG TPA: hypothetical protein VH044_20760 [Polyangiaceae bacterium]|jgi:hypothetical protein|nr:hypothetical protein [Polyangiaceae bacterium]
MPNVIRVRDVARNATYERPPQEAALRVPYDLFQPVGSVHRRGSLVDWLEGEVIKSGRAVATVLGETQPGERVLLRFDDSRDADDEWWLCEIVAVDGVAGHQDR